MGKPAKFSPWLNLAAGLLWLLKAARDTWAPEFLSVTGRHDFTSFAFVSAALFLTAACLGFMRMRPHSAR